MSLKDAIAHDINVVFMNADEFCDNLTIQSGTTKLNVIGSLQQNLIKNNSGNGNVLQSFAWTMYIKYPLNVSSTSRILSSGARILVNSQSFTVVDVAEEMGCATIHLTANGGR